MERFLKNNDYFQIKPEIFKLLDGSAGLSGNVKLLKAEQAAVDQVKNMLSGRFDCNRIFTPSTTDPDNRDRFIVMIVIDLVLYHLYSQTASKDIPEHRQQRYHDAVEWLRDAALGKIQTNLPSALSNIEQGDIRIWSAQKPENYHW